MIPTRFLSTAALLLTLALAASAWSDEPPKAEPPPDPCRTELTLEKLDNPPERKTKFEVSKDVTKVKLHDIKLIGQKYVASFVIALPRSLSGNRQGRSVYLREDKELTDLQYVLGRPLLAPDIFTGQYYGGEYSPLAQIIAQIPPKRLPTKDELEFLGSAKVTQFLSFPTSSQTSSQGAEAVFQIFAITPEQAESRIRTFLTILDQGFSRPIQLALFEERGKQCESLRAAQEKHAAARKQWESLTGKLKEYEEFTPDMLSGLRVQQLQLEVDLAGVKAKIATCEKLLAKASDAERRKQIEDAKIAAEIELSGFEARREKSAEFVGKLKERNELTGQQVLAGNEMVTQSKRIQQTTEAIQRIDEEIAAFAPVTLVDDRVTIHPLEWTQ